ncbi:hypothetical protein JB92DRAFT_2826436 [Gautieria morchelliformis]|nr:hypothetical protein JB92DRAFT_2826436 [Gautieria morchelliformis]
MTRTKDAWAGPSRHAHVPQPPSLTLTYTLNSTNDRRRAISPSPPRLNNGGVRADEDIVLDEDAAVSERGVSAQGPQHYLAGPPHLRAAQPPSDRYIKKSKGAYRGPRTQTDFYAAEDIASDEVRSDEVISGDDVANESVPGKIVHDEVAYDSDSSDGGYGVPQTPPHHTRAGPSRRTQAPQPAPSTCMRVHKPQKKAGSNKEHRRATATFPSSCTLLGLRFVPQYGLSPQQLHPSGFRAAWVVKTLLERGFHGDYPAIIFKAHADRFEYITVEDIAKEGAFDEAVKGGAQGSPIHFKAEDPDFCLYRFVELIVPTVTGVLKSISKFGHHLTRGASARRPFPKRIGEFLAQEAKIKGKDATNIYKYRASKTLAERGESNLVGWQPPLLRRAPPVAAWEFVAKNKSEIHWDLAVLNPPMVWGRSMSWSKGHRLHAGGNWVDDRDVATAHGIIDAIHGGTASDAVLSALPKGTPGARKDGVYPVLLHTTKARTVLGTTFRELSETAQDTARSLLANERSSSLRQFVIGWAAISFWKKDRPISSGCLKADGTAQERCWCKERVGDGNS